MAHGPLQRTMSGLQGGRSRQAPHRLSGTRQKVVSCRAMPRLVARECFESRTRLPSEPIGLNLCYDQTRLHLAMKKRLPILAASLPLAITISTAGPAQAIDTCRTGVPTAYSFADVSASGFSCQLGDKIYSDFIFSGLTSGSFVFTNPLANFHTFEAQSLGLAAGFSGSYSYKVTIDPASAPAYKFLNFSTSTTVNNVGSGVISSKILTDGVNSVASVNGVDAPVYTYSPTNSGPINFGSNLSVTQGLLTQFTDTVTQAPQDVPGPLPIFGAAAAFGFSRQLRRKINA